MRDLQVRFVLPIVLLAVVAWAGPASAQMTLTDFQNLTLGTESYWNGSDGSGGFTSDELDFNNSYTPASGGYDEYWDGFAYSNTTDQTTPGSGNQYSAYVETPDSLNIYGVAYVNSYALQPPTFSAVDPDKGGVLESVSVTNTTYAALSMLEGDTYAKKFGGDTGDDADWFMLTFTGFNDGVLTGTTFDFYLADYRFADNSEDYIIDDWTDVDMTSLGYVDEIRLSLSSSDVGAWGMNTPAYVAINDITLTPEPSSIVMLLTGLLGLIWWRRRAR